MAGYQGAYNDALVGPSLGVPFQGSFLNIAGLAKGTITISPTAVAANTTAEQTFTVPGLLVGDVLNVQKPTAQAGLGLVNERVSAPNTMAITFVNSTGASITPTANEVYIFTVVR
jgi:cytoskeletal protein RodZ